MRFALALSSLAAVAYAAPGAMTLNDLQDHAAGYLKAAEANGCDWYKCVLAGAGEFAACAAAAAQLGLDPFADAACLLAVGSGFPACDGCRIF